MYSYNFLRDSTEENSLIFLIKNPVEFCYILHTPCVYCKSVNQLSNKIPKSLTMLLLLIIVSNIASNKIVLHASSQVRREILQKL